MKKGFVLSCLILILGCGGYRNTTGTLTFTDQKAPQTSQGVQTADSPCVKTLKGSMENNGQKFVADTKVISADLASQINNRLKSGQLTYFATKDLTSKKIVQLSLKETFAPTDLSFETLTQILKGNGTSSFTYELEYRRGDKQNQMLLLRQTFSVDETCQLKPSDSEEVTFTPAGSNYQVADLTATQNTKTLTVPQGGTFTINKPEITMLNEGDTLPKNELIFFSAKNPLVQISITPSADQDYLNENTGQKESMSASQILYSDSGKAVETKTHYRSKMNSFGSIENSQSEFFWLTKAAWEKLNNL